MDANMIKAWAEEKRSELAQLEGDFANLVQRREHLVNEIRHLDELASMAAGSGKRMGRPSIVEQSSSTSISDAAYLVLSEATEPLHIAELMERLLERGQPIPGRGTAANLIVHLTKDPRISRVARGVYGVADSPGNKASGASRSARRPPRPRRRSRTNRLPGGVLLPTADFEVPILEALMGTGGRATVTEVMRRVGKSLENKLGPMDRSRLSSGQVRWENRTQWARQSLVKKGELSKDSPHGIWEMSPLGRERPKAEQGSQDKPSLRLASKDVG